MSAHYKGFALLAILAATIVTTGPAFAQQSVQIEQPITVKTDKSSYGEGETITISGKVRSMISDTPVSITVRNPIGNVVGVDQVDVSSSNTYSTEFVAGGSVWKAEGTYTIKVVYGAESRSAKTNFEFSGVAMEEQPKPSKPSIPVENTDMSVEYTITGGSVESITAHIEHLSLIIDLKTTDDGKLTITLPRELIDAKKNGEDDRFFVLVNEQEEDYFETTTDTARTLEISFYDGTQQIEIIGTTIIPEFGPIAALVLAVAIISIIAISSRSKISLTPRY